MKSIERKIKLISLFTALLFAFELFSPVFVSNTVHATIFSSVSGIVVDDKTGNGIAAVKVALHRRPPFGTVRPVYFATTGASGQFKIKMVEPGDYDLIVSPQGSYVNKVLPYPIQVVNAKNVVGVKVTLEKG